MSRVAPRLLSSHRWELNEKLQHFSSLARLRATLERQLKSFGEPASNEDVERAQRRSHLQESLDQIDHQMEEARADVNASVRVLRMLENGSVTGQAQAAPEIFGR
jgi:ElaB/YqjD/DUF883 family membrane-anchored ribosome-binding protein